MRCAERETATVVPEAETEEADLRPGWRRFCEEVVGKVEVGLLAFIEKARPELDAASAKEVVMVWHFSFTQDARNYLVYTMVDTLFGFARHGEEMKGVVEDERFLNFVKFVMKEEHVTFLQADSKEDYFRTLTNRMLRLSKMVPYLQPGQDWVQSVPDDVVPADPVDALFEFYPPDGREAPERASAEETLQSLAVRMELARLDEEKDKGLLSAIQARKEGHPNLRRFEKRLEKLAQLVKGMTQQMLYTPEGGEAEVVSLFGRHLFFLVQAGSRGSVERFLGLQRALSRQGGREAADARACLQCSDFVPLVKESTCMPESLLSHIEHQCRQHGVLEEQKEEKEEEQKEEDQEEEEQEKEEQEQEEQKKDQEEQKEQQEEESSPRPKGEAQRQATPGGEEDPATSSPASGSQKPEEAATTTTKAAEDPAESLSTSLEAVRLDPASSSAKPPSPEHGKGEGVQVSGGYRTKAVADPPSLAAVTSPSKLVMEACKYFTDVKNLDGALQHCGGRCIFTVRSDKAVDYFCPVLGYLPLLPVLKVLTIRPERKVEERSV